jgi:hypothetical protein
MRWNVMLVCACLCALCAVLIACGCTGSDDRASPDAADYGGPARNMSGGQPPSGPPPGNMTGERPEMTMEMLEARVAEIEALGCDLPEVREAMGAGDQVAAQEVFREFLMEHRDELPEDFGGRAPAEWSGAPPP